MTRQERLLRIATIEQKLMELPKGKIYYKKIKGKDQPYLQWSEDGKAMTKYVKASQRNEVFRQLETRDRLLEEIAFLKEMAEEKNDIVEENAFRTNVVAGQALNDLICRAGTYQKRDCYGKLQRYINSETSGKVCILYGLRRTGKTTLLFQLLQDMTQEEREKAVLCVH